MVAVNLTCLVSMAKRTICNIQVLLGTMYRHFKIFIHTTFKRLCASRKVMEKWLIKVFGIGVCVWWIHLNYISNVEVIIIF